MSVVTNRFIPGLLARSPKTRYESLKRKDSLGKLEILSPWMIVADGDTFRPLLFIQKEEPQYLSDYFAGDLEFKEFHATISSDNINLYNADLSISTMTRDIVNQHPYTELFRFGKRIVIILGQNDFNIFSKFVGQTESEKANSIRNIVKEFSGVYSNISQSGIRTKDENDNDVLIQTNDEKYSAVSIFDLRIIKTSLKSSDELNVLDLDLSLMGSVAFAGEIVKVETDIFLDEIDKTLIFKDSIDTFLFSDIYESLLKSIRIPDPESIYLLENKEILLKIYSPPGGDGDDVLKELEQIQKEKLRQERRRLEVESNFTPSTRFYGPGESAATAGEEVFRTINKGQVNQQKIESKSLISDVFEKMITLENLIILLNNIVQKSVSDTIIQIDDGIFSEDIFLRVFTPKDTNISLYFKERNKDKEQRRLKNLLVPTRFLDIKDKYGGTESLKLKSFVAKILEEINSFYNNTIDLDSAIQGRDLIIFESTIKNRGISYFINNRVDQNDILTFNMFSEIDMLSSVSLTFSPPSDEAIGFLSMSNMIAPSLIAKILSDKESIVFATYLFNDLSRQNQTKVKDELLNSFNSLTGESGSMKKETLSKIFDRLQILIYSSNGKSLKETNQKKWNKYLKGYVVDVINILNSERDIIENHFNSFEERSFTGADSTFEAYKKITDKYFKIINTNPLYVFIKMSDLEGNVTIPGMGNLYPNQIFNMITGIKPYDDLQFGVKKVFSNVITEITHNVEPASWTTDISFRKLALNR